MDNVMTNELTVASSADVVVQHHKSFEDAKYTAENGWEYWSARELYPLLEYTEWRNFQSVVNKAKTACQNAGYPVNSNFVDTNKIAKTGIGEKQISDYHLSRYACYLIVQNGDPTKSVIANGQTYFASQTRLQELLENKLLKQKLNSLIKRHEERERSKELNKDLVELGYQYGCTDYGRIHNAFYLGFYDMTAENIKKVRDIKHYVSPYEWMDFEELNINVDAKIALQTLLELSPPTYGDINAFCDICYLVGSRMREKWQHYERMLPEEYNKADIQAKNLPKTISKLKEKQSLIEKADTSLIQPESNQESL